MKVGIIGAGKVGISLGYVLKRNGVEVKGFASTREDALTIAKSYCGESLLYTRDNFKIVEVSDVVGITTQDRNIKVVAESISEAFNDLRGKIFFHTSGSHSIAILSSLKKRGAHLGSLHPLQTFPDIESAIKVLPETYIFIEGEEESMPTLAYLAKRIGQETIRIESEKKVLYHLSAVFVCNLLCALLYAGSRIMERIGTELKLFLPIIRATLQNIEEKGPVLALTGPIVRGDVETVLAHLESIKEMPVFLETYKSLSLFALEMAKKRKALDIQTEERIENLLKDVLGGKHDRKSDKDS